VSDAVHACQPASVLVTVLSVRGSVGGIDEFRSEQENCNV